MSQTTIGINIEPHAIGYAVCQVNGVDVQVERFEVIDCKTSDEGELEAGLHKLASSLEQLRKKQIDAMGLTIDSSDELSAHRVFPFNTPALIESVLAQQMMDVWKIDDSAQISFEVGDKVEVSKMEDLEKTDESEDASGYDVHVINYPRGPLSNLLRALNRAQIDPHVAIPGTEAFRYLTESILDLPEETWVIVDIGEKTSQIYIGSGRKVDIARSMKIGLGSIDEIMSRELTISLDEARELRMRSGFLAVEGSEMDTQSELIQAGKIVDSESYNPIEMCRMGTRALSGIVTSLFQSMGNYVKTSHPEPRCIHVIGCGSQFPGLTRWLSVACDGPCETQLPFRGGGDIAQEVTLHPDVFSAAIAAAAHISGNCPLNLRHGALAHRGSLAYLKDCKWILGSLVLVLIVVCIVSFTSHANVVKKENEQLKAALSHVTQELFGQEMLKYNEIVAAVEGSREFNFIPVRTAFSHFAWISSNVNDNLADVNMDLQSLDIDTQRKIVTFRGDIVGDEGLPRFLQLLEQYECFPNEIPDPKTTKSKDKITFTLRVDANQCKMGGDSE